MTTTAIIDKLAETYQNWVCTAILESRNAATGHFTTCIHWEAIFLAAFQTASQDIQNVFSTNAPEKIKTVELIDYLKEVIKGYPHTLADLAVEDADYDEVASLWMTKLTDGKEGEVEGLVGLLKEPHAKVAEFFGGMYDLDAIVKTLEIGSMPVISKEDLFDSGDLLKRELFTRQAWEVLEEAAVRANRASQDFIIPVHVLSAILWSNNDPIETALRLYLPIQMKTFADFRAFVDTHIRVLKQTDEPMELSRKNIADTLQDKIVDALTIKRQYNSDEPLNVSYLFCGLLEKDEEKHNGIITSFFKSANANVERIASYVRKSAADKEESLPMQVPEGLAGRDFSWEAERENFSEKSGFDDIVKKVLGVIYRKKCNSTIILAHEGSGRTSFLQQLAIRMSSGEMLQYSSKKLVVLDCSKVHPEGRKTFLQRTLEFVYSKRDVVIAMDGLESVFIGQESAVVMGAAFLEQFQHALTKNALQFLITIDPAAYHATLAQDHRIAKLFEVFTLKEPSRDATGKILDGLLPDIQKRYNAVILPEAVEKALQLTEQYLLSEHFPKKAIDVLERAADSKTFRTEQTESAGTVGIDDVVATVSRITGIPESTLKGETGKVDFKKALENGIVGQPEAVQICARELSLIKAGMKDLERPASVMLFAGMTGTGKTEMAKTIANMYSATKRLVVFTMGNFTESHSVSGIIGVPPGYVGHDQGGRLINEINKDPYCVVLLDEIEKAHPEIWKPFLNLFDEGWVVDARNVRANASRCIFILTSNVGAQEASDLYAHNASYEDIQEEVKERLFEHVFSNTTIKCFTPEFLARIQQIVVFRPLDEQAMGSIVKRTIENKIGTYRRLRSKTLAVSEEFRNALTAESMDRYRSSKGREGGRVVRKVIAEYVDGALEKMDSDRFQTAVRIGISGNDIKNPVIEMENRKMSGEEMNREYRNILGKSGIAAKEYVNLWAGDIQSKYDAITGSDGKKEGVLSKAQKERIEQCFQAVLEELDKENSGVGTEKAGE